MMPNKNILRKQIYERDGNKCHYCGIAEKDFFTIWGDFYGSKKRGSRLEVDRKDNRGDYEIDNCVLACAICNCAKSDKFTYDEFKYVGKAIGRVWLKRMH